MEAQTKINFLLFVFVENTRPLFRFVSDIFYFCLFLREGWNPIIYGHKLHAINFLHSVLYMFIC